MKNKKQKLEKLENQVEALYRLLDAHPNSEKIAKSDIKDIIALLEDRIQYVSIMLGERGPRGVSGPRDASFKGGGMDKAETKKVVINRCFGGFSVSKEVYDYLGREWGEDSAYEFEDDRENKDLIRAIEALGRGKASGDSARLKIVEIPKDVEYIIDHYDGYESIAEKHRTWQ